MKNFSIRIGKDEYLTTLCEIYEQPILSNVRYFRKLLAAVVWNRRQPCRSHNSVTCSVTPLMMKSLHHWNCAVEYAVLFSTGTHLKA